MKFIKGVNFSMKKGAYENSKLKYQLLEKKRKGVKEVIWKLNSQQKGFIEETLKFIVEPYLYKIRTKSFYNISDKDSLLKDIHYKNKRGVQECVFKLNSKQIELLDEFGVKYKPYKYKIKLSS